MEGQDAKSNHYSTSLHIHFMITKAGGAACSQGEERQKLPIALYFFCGGGHVFGQNFCFAAKLLNATALDIISSFLVGNLVIQYSKYRI